MDGVFSFLVDIEGIYVENCQLKVNVELCFFDGCLGGECIWVCVCDLGFVVYFINGDF